MGNLDGYIFTIARNKTLNHLRKAAYDVRLLKELQERASAAELTNNVGERAMVSEYDRLLQDALALLSPQLRILFQQFVKDGFPVRSWGGAPPDGQTMDKLLKIRCTEAGHELPLVIEYDKMIWSGLSWAAGKLRQGSFDPAAPVKIECSSTEKEELRLEARVYAIDY